MSTPSQPGYPPPKPFHRPIGVAILSVILIIVGALVTIGGIAAILAFGFIGLGIAGPMGGLLGAALGFGILIVGGITLLAGLGLWRMRGWAWWLAIFVLVLQLAFGIGGWIIPAILILYLILVRKHFNT